MLIHASIHLFIDYSIHPFIFLSNQSIHPLDYSSIHILFRRFLHPSNPTFTNLSICHTMEHKPSWLEIHQRFHPSKHLFVHSPSHPFIHPSIPISIHSFIPLTIYSILSIHPLHPSVHPLICLSHDGANAKRPTSTSVVSGGVHRGRCGRTVSVDSRRLNAAKLTTYSVAKTAWTWIGVDNLTRKIHGTVAQRNTSCTVWKGRMEMNLVTSNRRIAAGRKTTLTTANATSRTYPRASIKRDGALAKTVTLRSVCTDLRATNFTASRKSNAARWRSTWDTHRIRITQLLMDWTQPWSRLPHILSQDYHAEYPWFTCSNDFHLKIKCVFRHQRYSWLQWMLQQLPAAKIQQLSLLQRPRFL